MSDAAILKLVEQGSVVLFMIWLVRYTIPFIDKWVARWMNDVTLRFDNSQKSDATLLEKYHLVDKRLDKIENDLKSLRIAVGIAPDRRHHEDQQTRE